MKITNNLTKAYINLNNLQHNMELLQSMVGRRPLWPAIKANAYGHGKEIIAKKLLEMGYHTLCVAHVTEAIELLDKGITANYILLSASLSEHSDAIVSVNCEPTVCDYDIVESLNREAGKAGKKVPIHVKVDTGMGRIGIQPNEVEPFLTFCKSKPNIVIKGIMSHFPCADQADKTVSRQQIKDFTQIVRLHQLESTLCHMANSAAIFDLSDSYFDAARPGISIYGLKPSPHILNSKVNELKPVLEWKTQITFLKEVLAGTGLSYGHTYFTKQPSLIATIPIGYGDGLNRNLSNNMEVLVCGVRCPQVGRITMDQTLVDVSVLRGRVNLGDEAVIIGCQGQECISADELAEKLNTINYEIVTAVSARVARIETGN